MAEKRSGEGKRDREREKERERERAKTVIHDEVSGSRPPVSQSPPSSSSFLSSFLSPRTNSSLSLSHGSSSPASSPSPAAPISSAPSLSAVRNASLLSFKMFPQRERAQKEKEKEKEKESVSEIEVALEEGKEGRKEEESGSMDLGSLLNMMQVKGHVCACVYVYVLVFVCVLVYMSA